MMNAAMKGLWVAFVLTVCVPTLSAEQAPAKLPVKVLVLTMFEVDKNTGDVAGEFQYWYEAYFAKARSYSVKGFMNPLYLNDRGVAGCVTGMGKAQAASALAAILSDRRFDFSRTYILVTGCAGISPARGTVGDVIWADALVDYELGHAWTESDITKSMKGTFARDPLYDRCGYIPLNKELVQWAYALTKDCPLTDDIEAAAYRANYGPAEAKEKPSVRKGVSVTGDNYWHGKGSSAHADEVCSSYKTESPYMAAQMEDNAFGLVALNFGLLDRFLVCRDAVDFDRPPDGQSVEESLVADSDGFSIGMKNGFVVGSKVVEAIVSDWDVYAKQTPKAK
jgi:purine nucleoside permease